VSRGKNGLYRRATMIAFATSLLGSLALAAWALWIRNSNPQLAAAMFVGAALFPFYLGLAQWKGVLLGRTRFNVWSAIEVTTTFATSALVIGAVLLDVRDIALFVALYLLPASLANIGCTAYFFTRADMRGAADSEMRAMLQYGVHTSIIGILSVVAERIERIMIFLLTGPAALAAYYAGDRISELVRSVVQDAAAVLAPRFARTPSYSGRVQRLIWLVCMAAGILIVLFAVFLARPVLLLVFGPQYEPSVIYAQLLLCSVALGNVGEFQFRFIRSQADKEAFRTVTLTTSAVRIGAALILVPLWDIWGAIASVSIHRAMDSIVSTIVINRRFAGTGPE
jgi:O-antigen/teichoic acid export membrane protein